MTKYSDLLKDPRWQKKRLQIFERDGWECTECHSKEHTLCVHHISYSGEPWEADDSCLVTLCEGCHDLEEDLKNNEFLLNTANILGITRISVWRMFCALVYVKKNNPDEWSIVNSTLKSVVNSNKSEFLKTIKASFKLGENG